MRRALEDEPQLGLRDRQALAGPDEDGNARPAPVVDLQAERGVGLGGRVGGDAVDVAIALVLAAYVVRGVSRRDRGEQRVQRVLERRLVAGRGDLHRRRGDDLHEVVDHDVAQRADRVVEVAAVVDAEALGHRDLDRGQVLATPDRLERRVREAQVEDLRRPHLPEEVVDAIQLRFVDVAVDLLGERAGGGQVVAERLLHDDARAVGQPCLREALDHRAEEERRDLEIEDRAGRALERRGDAGVRRLVAEVPGHVGHPRRQAVEDRVVDLLTGALDGRAGMLAELVVAPVLDRDAQDRAVQQASSLQPVQRPERHDLGEVTCDAEAHESVGAARRIARHRETRRARSLDCGHVRPLP